MEKNKKLFSSLAGLTVGALAGVTLLTTSLHAEDTATAPTVSDHGCSGDQSCSGDKECSGDKSCSGDKGCGADGACSGDESCSGAEQSAE